MMTILAWLFWSSVLLLLYSYVLFPALLWCRARLFERPVRASDCTPSISMIIAAHNEQASIGAKLDNVLQLDYPRDRLEVLVASDGSTDQTEQIVVQYADRGVRLFALPRQGKAKALNAVVPQARGEVLVFSDANSMYAPDALRALVRPLADPCVGGVAGDQRYVKQNATAATGTGERSYWDIDRLWKLWQSRAGHVTSATGAIYAIRRRLFQAVPEGVTDDFVTSTRVIAQGYRLVFASDAAAYEEVAASGNIEFGRKVRVILRGLRGVLVMRELLNPRRHGFYALQLFSHKVLRRLMAVPLLVLLLTSSLLASHSPLYLAPLLLQLVGYGTAGLGGLAASLQLRRWRAVRLLSLPFYFCMVNVASLIAVVQLLQGRKIVIWNPTREEADAHAVTS